MREHPKSGDFRPLEGVVEWIRVQGEAQNRNIQNSSEILIGRPGGCSECRTRIKKNFHSRLLMRNGDHGQSRRRRKEWQGKEGNKNEKKAGAEGGSRRLEGRVWQKQEDDHCSDQLDLYCPVLDRSRQERPPAHGGSRVPSPLQCPAMFPRASVSGVGVDENHQHPALLARIPPLPPPRHPDTTRL